MTAMTTTTATAVAVGTSLMQPLLWSLLLFLGMLLGFTAARLLPTKQQQQQQQQQQYSNNNDKASFLIQPLASTKGRSAATTLAASSSSSTSSATGTTSSSVLTATGAAAAAATSLLLSSSKAVLPLLLDPTSSFTVPSSSSSTTTTTSSIATATATKVAKPLLPKHIAVIMDGNRRYGKMRHNDALKGHWEGAQRLVDFVQWCMAANIEVLTVYAFSSENWQRDQREVDTLMSMLVTYADTLLKEVVDKNVRVKILSTDLSRLPLLVQTRLQLLQEQSRRCCCSGSGSGLLLNIAISYGGRQELLIATRRLCNEVAMNRISVDDIDEQLFASHLSTSHCCDPDLLLRTSGEQRLSNFLPFQSTYTELVFTHKLWPELTQDDLRMMLEEYASRQRRYGT